MRAASAIVVLAVFVCAAPVAAQTDGGQIRGVLSGARGPIPNAEVRIKNTATEQVTVTTTSQTGEFSATVPAGTYDVFSSTVGYAVLARRGVTVKAGATERVDAKLGDNANAGTPGEIFFLYERAEKKPPTGPAPRTRDGKPDLSGVWYPGPDLEPEVPPMLPWAEELFKKRSAKVGDDPRAQCLPSGIVRTHGLDLAKFVQTPDVLIMLVESSVPGVRQVFLDGRPHPPEREPVLAGPLSGSMGRGHAGHRHHRTQRSRVAGPDRQATDGEGAHHRALPPSRPRTPGGRDHDRRSRGLHQTLEGPPPPGSRAWRRDPRVHLPRESQDGTLRELKGPRLRAPGSRPDTRLTTND